jgi:hypothetical protein
MTSSRSLGGRRAVAAGKGLEAVLEVLHSRYESEGRAVLLYTGTRSRAVKRGGQLAFVAGPSLPDYVGTVAGGMGVAFDAKSSAEASWYLPATRVHQYHVLQRLSKLGGLSFFLVECRRSNLVYLVRVLPSPYFVMGPPRLNFQDTALDPFLYPLPVIVAAPEMGTPVDWLEAVGRYWLSKEVS